MTEDILEGQPNDILLSHFGLSEAQLQSGISITTKLKMQHMMKYKLIILGHYHKPQKISMGETCLFYVGSPVHTSWNDKNEKKRFLVYNTETLEVKTFEMPDFTLYKEYSIDNLSDAKEVLEQANKDRDAGHKVRIKKMIKDEIDNDSNLVILEENYVDITQRGINVSMNLTDKLEKYVEIMEIPDDQRSEYVDHIKSIISGEFPDE